MSTKTEYNTMMLFKAFLSFLEVYGQENFGENVEIDWCKVWSFVNASHVLDFNPWLTELIMTEPNSEEFEQGVHKFLEDRILNDEPVYELFNLNNWLYDKLHEEHLAILDNKEIERFNNSKCYRCKHFHDNTFVYVEMFGQLNQYNYNDPQFKQYAVNYPIHHHATCRKRTEIVEQARAELKKEFYHVSDMDCNECIDYEKFHFRSRNDHWNCVPQEHDNCPYFKETNITYQEYIDIFGELV